MRHVWRPDQQHREIRCGDLILVNYEYRLQLDAPVCYGVRGKLQRRCSRILLQARRDAWVAQHLQHVPRQAQHVLCPRVSILKRCTPKATSLNLRQRGRHGVALKCSIYM